MGNGQWVIIDTSVHFERWLRCAKDVYELT